MTCPNCGCSVTRRALRSHLVGEAIALAEKLLKATRKRR